VNRGSRAEPTAGSRGRAPGHKVTRAKSGVKPPLKLSSWIPRGNGKSTTIFLCCAEVPFLHV